MRPLLALMAKAKNGFGCGRHAPPPSAAHTYLMRSIFRPRCMFPSAAATTGHMRRRVTMGPFRTCRTLHAFAVQC